MPRNLHIRRRGGRHKKLKANIENIRQLPHQLSVRVGNVVHQLKPPPPSEGKPAKINSQVADALLVPYTSRFNAMDCETGIATAGSDTSLTDSGRGEADDYFNGWILTVIAGTGLGETATIDDDFASGVFNFTALSGGSTPDTTTVYYVEPASNLHPAGFRFDNYIKSACYAEVEKQIAEINEGAVELFYKVDLPAAHRIDGLSRPRRLRSKRLRYRSGYPHRHRTWHNVTTDNDM